MIMYLEMIVLCIFIACAVSIIHYVHKLVEQGKQIIFMIEGYEHQMKTMNQRLYDMECDTYDMAQKIVRSGTDGLHENK